MSVITRKKSLFFFLPCVTLREELKQKKLNLHYTHLDDKENSGSFYGEVKRAVKKYKPQAIIVTFPGEYRVWNDVQRFRKRISA